MHLRRLHIENFKGLKQLDVSFIREDGSVRPLTLLLGANGSGKTSVLQAIALVLSLATRKIAEPGDFTWPGFLLERIGSGGHTRIELELEFPGDELVVTRKLFDEWQPTIRRDLANSASVPSDTPQITLVYQDGRLRCEQGDSALSQCLGRYFIRTILRTNPWLRRQFRSVGDVFWFDQNRNLLVKNEETFRSDATGETMPGIEVLRQYLITWYAVHSSPRKATQTDYLHRLEALFARVFPGTRFVGVEPRPGLSATSPSDSYFLLQQEGRTYDLAEMSSGEQAVFPLIYEFVRLEIARSIVLIDELELHLHPPAQQTLLASLRTLSPDCQFLVTSHSPYLESAVPDDEEIRLKGGLLCL